MLRKICFLLIGSMHAGSDWKRTQTQTIREKNERLQKELTECLAVQAYLREYVNNLEAELGGVRLFEDEPEQSQMTLWEAP